MRILIVNKFRWRKGGSETYCFGLADALERAGHEVAWFAMEDSRNEPSSWERYFAPNVDYSEGGSPLVKAKAAATLLYSSEAKRRFERLCQTFRPDAVHLNLVHRQLTLSILDAHYLAESKTPVVWTSHDYIGVCPGYLMLDGAGNVCEKCLDGRFSHCIEGRCVKGSRAKSALATAEAAFLRAHGCYERIDRVVAPSKFMRSMLLRGGFEPANVLAIPNFVDAETLGQACDDTDRTNRERPYVLFFGRLSPEKGALVLLDAFLSVAEGLPDCRLVLAGEGPALPALKEKLACAGEAAARVELAGFQSGAKLRSLIAGALLAVIPSVWYENMPYSVTEALAAGTPVVASEIGGIPELVCEGETGFLCKPADAESLAQALLRGAGTYADRNSYTAMQRRCRTWVLCNCDPSAYAERMARLYEEIAAEKKGTC